MAKKTISLATIVLISLISTVCHGQNTTDTTQKQTYHRYYEFGIAPNYDLNNPAINGVTVYKLSQDLFSRGIRPKMGKKGGKIVNGFWSFGFTYLSMIWPHEFGHSMRAQQANGYFKIHNIALPIPYTTMHLPDTSGFYSAALASIGGFEVNYLTARNIESDYFEYNGLYKDELALAFAHRMMYPVYASLVIPRDASDPDVWQNTAGDPVHFVKPVWQMYSNDQILMPDGTVNPGLVKFYNQSAFLATFWNLASPTFYQTLAGMTGDVIDGKRPKFLIGDNEKGWTYSTLFNTSMLGYELYMNNYLKMDGKMFVAYIKYGRPFKNNGFGLRSPNLIQQENLKIGGSVEVWDQDLYGKGFSAFADGNYQLADRFSARLQAGYKTQGYVLGRKMESGFIGMISINYLLEQAN